MDEDRRTGKADEFSDFVDRYLIVRDARCHRHCESSARFVPLKNDVDGLVGAYVCPESYVSRIVYFSLKPDREWFEKYLENQAGDLVRSRDIRVATRHGWELGDGAENEVRRISRSGGVTQIYWTRYPALDREKTSGPFLCANGERLFVKAFSDGTKFCPACRGSGL